MIKLITIFIVSFFISSCAFIRPDYLAMLSPVQLNKLMQTQDVFLMDVHIPEQRHIKGTDVFIPYNEIEKYSAKLPSDKQTPIYLYCRSGAMANAAARTLHELGYSHLNNLEGGAEAWHEQGFAFE